MSSITACATLFIPFVGSLAAVSAPVHFTKTVYDDPQPSDPYLKNVWPGLTERLTQQVRAVVPNFPPPGHNAPNTFWIATFSINSKKVMLSIVDHLQAGCQGSGMHHDTLPHDFACPIRLTVIDNNKYLTTDAGMACFYRDNTFATFDAAARTFHVYSVLDGKPAPDCDATIPLTEGTTP